MNEQLFTGNASRPPSLRQHALILFIVVESDAALRALRTRGGRDARGPSKEVDLFRPEAAIPHPTGWHLRKSQSNARN